MKSYNYSQLLVVFLFSISFLQAQEYTISGYIRDAENGETLIGSFIYLAENGASTVSNEYGFYSITVEEGNYTLYGTYLGYKDNIQAITLTQNRTINIEMAPDANTLDEVVVTAEEVDRNVRSLEMSVNKLDIKTLEKLPTLLGETEILRGIQLLPGVTSVGEGAAGFNVRGGSIDQNLVLLDEAPVYNSSHLFGFFSVFNPDAVKDVKLYKGGIPARFGGRLSSILDVRMKEGNNKELEVNGGIGTIFSRLSVEAPIIKDKSSFIVAGRRSYIDVLAAPFLSDDAGDTELNFYDLTLKTNYKFSDKDQIFLSGYFGRDNFGFGESAGFSWGNQTGTFRWNHLFSDKLFANLTTYFSNYDYQINFGDTSEDTFDWTANIKNYSIKPEFSWFIRPQNILRFGGQTIYYIFEPANAISVSNSEVTDISTSEQFSLESNVFVENEITLFNKLQMNYGLRLSHFAYLGGRNVYNFGEAPLGEVRPLESTTVAEDGEVIEDYINLEPRFSLKVDLNEKSSFKASYNRTAQYIHLLSNTTASTPVDIWTPATNNIKPAMADQVAAGYFRNFKDNTYEFSGELYYKKMNNLIDYIDGADLILNELVEGQILEGEGRAYGAEFMLKKTEGRFSGWVSYTLARSERLVEGINNNDWYPSRFDQTHNLSITTFYELSDRLTLSANFVYNTGTPTTFANSGYYQQGYFIPNNDLNERNNVRIPDYHRLDLSLTLDPKPGKRKWKGQWVFGIYNVYARRNPFSIYFRQDDARVNPGQAVNTEAIRLSVIGSFIPSISYNFTFK
ncbi:MAG: TonB-dependent receptor [Bacteroidota bacterium]